MVRTYLVSVNCLTNTSLAKVDQYLISLYNFKTLSSSKVMRRAKLVSRGYWCIVLYFTFCFRSHVVYHLWNEMRDIVKTQILFTGFHGLLTAQDGRVLMNIMRI